MNIIFAILLTIIPNTQISDATTVTTKPLLEVFTDAEMAGAGPVSIVWAETVDIPSAFVPYRPSEFPECDGAERCIIFSRTYWAMTNVWYGDVAEDARRAMVAHEFGHVLSLERKETDRAYIQAVNRIHEECLADAIATVVLERNDWAPSVTDRYNVSYQCEKFWMDEYGEDRSTEAIALAEDLLNWASHRWDEPETDIGTPPVLYPTNTVPAGVATATAGATRITN